MQVSVAFESFSFKHFFSRYDTVDDDPLPAIEGLQITGEAFPGRELRACGYSINGTTSCNFEVLLTRLVVSLETFSLEVTCIYIRSCMISGFGIWKMDLSIALLVFTKGHKPIYYFIVVFCCRSELLCINIYLVTGAKQPDYLFTADDGDSYLAIEVQPFDDRKRKVSLFCLGKLICEMTFLFMATISIRN